MEKGNYYLEQISRKLKYPFHVAYSTSPRKFLLSVNMLLIFCSCIISAISIYASQLLYDPEFYFGWLNWSGLATVGVFLFFIAILGMRGAHLVSLEILLTYFWGTIVLVVPLLLGVYAVFNFNFYTRIWFKHEWAQDDFLPLRSLFCSPMSTARTKCRAPLEPESLVDDMYIINNSTGFSVEQWCINNYNATDCASIRDNAIDDAVLWAGRVLIVITIVGFITLIVLGFSVYTSYRILTSPVITQSMMDVINYLLLLPIAGCLYEAYTFWWFRRIENLDYTWLPVLWVALGAAQIVCLPLGIIAGRIKSRKLLRGYIVLSLVITGGLALAGATGWAVAKIVLNDYNPSSEFLGELACVERSLPGCSECHEDPPECPEWNQFEVLSLISLEFNFAGMVSTVSTLYLVGAIIVALLIENNLKNYKSDFI